VQLQQLTANVTITSLLTFDKNVGTPTLEGEITHL